MSEATPPKGGLPPHKAPHAALQDALFVYAVGSDGAGADLIRGWPALVERVVSDVAGGPWGELLCDLDDWSLDGDDVPFRYCVNFEDGYMAIYRVHDDREAVAIDEGRDSIGTQIAKDEFAKRWDEAYQRRVDQDVTPDAQTMRDELSKLSYSDTAIKAMGDSTAMMQRAIDACAAVPAQTGEVARDVRAVVLSAIRNVTALMNGRTPEATIEAGRNALDAIRWLAALAQSPASSALVAEVREVDTPWQLLEMARRVISAYRNGDSLGNSLGENIRYLQDMAERAESLPKAARDVMSERRRQTSAEGWTREHDDEHADGALAEAAACYASHAAVGHELGPRDVPRDWPWAKKWWKPGAPRRMLVKAGALIIAEIERLDRAALAASSVVGEQP